jgi:hypothetical protein
VLKLYLQDDVPDDTRSALLRSAPTKVDRNGSSTWLRALVHRLVTLPEFHLS